MCLGPDALRLFFRKKRLKQEILNSLNLNKKEDDANVIVELILIEVQKFFL